MKSWLWWSLGITGAVLLVVVVSQAVRPKLAPMPTGPEQGEGRTYTLEANPPGTSTESATDLTETRKKDALVAELNTMANNLLMAGNLTGAVQAYRQAIALTPQDEDLHFNLGIAYARLEDYTNAEKSYQEALKLLPDYPEVHNNLGNLLMRLGRMDEAEQHFIEAIEQMPEYAQAHNNLGILRQRQKRPSEALVCFQKAVALETNYPEARFNLAGAYVHANELPKAIAELRETLRIKPDFALAERALQSLLARGSNAPPPLPGVK